MVILLHAFKETFDENFLLRMLTGVELRQNERLKRGLT